MTRRCIQANPRRGVARGVASACWSCSPSWAGATDVDSLQAKVEAAKGEAGEIAERLRAAQGELAAARQRGGRGRRPRGTAQRPARRRRAARGRAGRQGRALRGAPGRREAAPAPRPRRRSPQRLVAIYESGAPSEASVILGSSDFDELDHPHRLPGADRGIRRGARARASSRSATQVRGELRAVAELKRAGRRLRREAGRGALGNLRRARRGRIGRRRAAVGRRRPVRLALDAEIADRHLGQRHRRGGSGEPRRRRRRGRPLARRPLLDPRPTS